MPDLNNSKRLQFKATHSAVHVDPNSTADSRSAGMVQSGVAMAAQIAAGYAYYKQGCNKN